jgi:Predicted ATP-dependent protease
MTNELKYSEIAFAYQAENLPSGDEKNSAIVGQDRALSALALGMKLMRPGYNLFLSGDFGTGKLSSVRNEYENLKYDLTYLRDCLYVRNFDNEDSPLAICLEKGKGERFKKDLLSLRDGGDFAAAKRNWPEAEHFLTLLEHRGAEETDYEANLAISHAGAEVRPFLIETHPSFENLFGYYDENAKAKHLGIHPGSFEQAAGGFLVITAEELLSVKMLWEALKRHLDTTYMALKTPFVKSEIGEGSRIRPQAIPAITKVIFLGSDDIYDELSDGDDQFLRLFKLAPQYDYQMKATKAHLARTISYIEKCAKGRIRKEAVAEVLRYSSWFTEDRETLTTQLTLLGDLVAEAGDQADRNGREAIERQDVISALKEREFFSSITEAKINHEISDGELIISLTGSKVGVVNGLAVMDRGLASFGTPTVISVTVAPGSEGIVNIEHEAGLSGEIHDKGILILEGFLRMQYARNFPLSIYAGICFEQNYAEIDGDSASSSELYALLSAIGEIPIRQDVGVTGSVNQMGIIQPVGGINEKILGFYKACKLNGLTGKQGVIIPYQNIRSLILDYEVEEAVKNGAFHIWAVKNINEGLEILTGLKMGERDRKGIYPQGSFNRIIEDKLRKLYEAGSAKA